MPCLASMMQRRGRERRHHHPSILYLRSSGVGCGHRHTAGPAYGIVPTGVLDHLLTWAHTVPVSGHPGIGRTIACLTEKYWWLLVYFSSCSICAQSKTPRHLPYGKLHNDPGQSGSGRFLMCYCQDRSGSGIAVVYWPYTTNP